MLALLLTILFVILVLALIYYVCNWLSIEAGLRNIILILVLLVLVIYLYQGGGLPL